MNHLSKEKSPYLLQHAENPVNWHPWGEGAFAEAKKRNCPIFLSIGYSTCYWCHVMEKDSFEHQEVADALAPFVAIKIDREERPDIDNFYMDFIVGLNGQGGWPMSVFLTPDRVPFWGGTFFRRAQFISILNEIASAWINRRGEIESSATSIKDALSRSVFIEPGDHAKICPEEVVQGLTVVCEQRFDPVWGGFGKAPKFPATSLLPLLTGLVAVRSDERLQKFLSTTLEMMHRGGLYDHIEGGFSRYSTDVQWLVPHFEKMLYDNALLLKIYAENAHLDAAYPELIKQTLDYLKSSLWNEKASLYYSAQDAGEVGKEGEYYLWSYDELKSLCTEQELKILERKWGITEDGNFEKSNIIHRMRAFSMQVDGEDNAILQKLKANRKTRVAPHVDKKSLADWNGLILSALCAAGKALEDDNVIKEAAVLADSIWSGFFCSVEHYHRIVDGERAVDAMLDDYAFCVAAFLDIYELTFEKQYLEKAVSLFDTQCKKLFDAQSKAFKNSSASDLLVPHIGFVDGATPSGNGVTAHNAIRLWHHTEDDDYKIVAEGIISAAADVIKDHPFAAPTVVRAFLNLSVYGGKISLGNELSEEEARDFLRNISPWLTVTTKKGAGRNITLCRNSGMCEELKVP